MHVRNKLDICSSKDIQQISWFNKSVPTEADGSAGSAGLQRMSMGDSGSFRRTGSKPNPQHRDRVRRSVTSAAGVAPEHPRPADYLLFPIV